MAAYLITFEINSGKRGELVERLKKFGSYCPMNHNCWIVISPLNAEEILQSLQPYTDPTRDRMFVLKTGSEAAWSNIYGVEWQNWLKSNLV